MTDRHAGYVVDAIRMIRGVIGVEPVESDITLQIAQIRVDGQWRDRLLDLVRAGLHPRTTEEGS